MEEVRIEESEEVENGNCGEIGEEKCRRQMT